MNEKKPLNNKNKNKKRIRRVLLFVVALTAFLVVIRYIRVRHFTDYTVREKKPDYTSQAGCSVYIYLCGSNLESRQGLAGKNIDELLKADIPANVQVVLQTGGAQNWHSHGISSEKLQRYIVKDNKLELVDELEDASMGSPDTLSGFLKWGREHYPADRRFLVLWDHGGSSAEGVCYDEKHEYDCLDRSELKKAFEDAGMGASGSEGARNKYDMIIFDACYMGCIETAAIAQDYFDYMIASQKIIPGGGLDYTGMISSLSENDDEAMGRVICDDYYAKHKKSHTEENIQLSFYDLAGTEQVVKALESAGTNLLIRQKTINGSFKMIHAAANSVIGSADEKINLVDMLAFMEQAVKIDLRDHYDEIRQSKDALLPYQVAGKETECTGVSMYYPLNYDESQTNAYLELCPVKSYAKLLENVYNSVPENAILFKNTGSISEDGRFTAALSKESRKYLFAVSRKVWKESENRPGSWDLLGEDATKAGAAAEIGVGDLVIDDDFDGMWYHLDGHPLLTSVRARRITTSVSAPVRVNGNDALLSFAHISSGRIIGSRRKRFPSHGVLSAGTDEYGLPDRDVKKLKKGDLVQVYAASNESGQSKVLQDEFETDTDGGKIEYLPLPSGNYRIQYVAADILGRTASSDYALIRVAGEDDNRTVQVIEIQEAQ